MTGSPAPDRMGRIPVPTFHRAEPPACRERHAGLTLVPALSTALYYVLPPGLQSSVTVQLLPQVLAYLAFAVWSTGNRPVIGHLGLEPEHGLRGLSWGIPVGLALGLLNSWVILQVVPGLGADIEFLKHTPHAQVPIWLMVPWVIVVIALFVEVNFRGFQLGRWLALFDRAPLLGASRTAPVAAVSVSALLFAFDPFMVETFQHLHWIAVWDAVVWGCLWLKLRNLYATITAHAVEVIVMYLTVRAAFT